jgi:hypothetical protein
VWDGIEKEKSVVAVFECSCPSFYQLPLPKPRSFFP